MLKRRRRRHPQRLPQLAHELPRVQRIQEVDVPRRAIEHLKRQSACGEDPRGNLVRIDPVAERELHLSADNVALP